MPSLADFLARALPWPAPGAPGVVNLHWQSWKGRGVTGGKPFTDLQDLLSFAKWAQSRGEGIIRELYYCTSLQKEAGPQQQGTGKPTALRNRANTLCSKMLFTDIDKGYETPAHALAAVAEFCATTHSPAPTALVMSGNGLHVYWFSDKALEPDEWSRYARALDVLLTVNGVIHDSITTDITRLLRLPGTLNNKGHEKGIGPKLVVLKMLAPNDIDFTGWDSLNAVKPESFTPVGSVIPRPSIPPEELFLSPEVALKPASKIITDALKPSDWLGEKLDPVPILQCPMFEQTLATHGDGVSQPLWNQQALACTFIRDGERLFHELSSGDPRYSYEETQEMFARKVDERIKHKYGYPLCGTFEREGAKQCVTCPLRGTIKSPLSLKYQHLSPPDPDDPNHLELPAGYVYSETRPGAIDCLVATNRKIPIQHPMILSVLSNFSCTKNRSGEFELSFRTTIDKDRFAEVTIKNDALASPIEVCKIFTKAGVDYLPSQATRICDLMNTFMGRLKQFNRVTVSTPYGWVISTEEGEKAELSGFAYGGKIFRIDGSVDPAATGDRVLNRTYMPRGDKLSWFTALDTLLRQDRIPLQTIALCGFASPLMKLTGFHGLSVMAWGDSGGNKSTASRLACAIWGSPKGVKEVPSTSSLSLLGKMAETRHLLNCWDDIQKGQYERVGKMLMEITQGKGGGKLTTSHDQKNMGEWDSILLTTSNDSLGSFVVQANKNDAAALFRCFEFEVEKATENSPGRANPLTVEPIYAALDDNFGYIGLHYAKILGQKLSQIQQVLGEAQSDIMASLGKIPDNERYWATAATCLLASSIIGNAIIISERKELGLPAGPLFNTDGIRAHLLQVYQEMRERVKGAAVESSSPDYVHLHLTDFLNDFSKQSVWAEGGWKQPNLIFPDAAAMRFMDRVVVRWNITDNEVIISRRALTDYLFKREVAGMQVVNGLKKYYDAKLTKRRIAAGIFGASSVQEHLLVIPIKPGSWLHETLMEHSQS